MLSQILEKNVRCRLCTVYVVTAARPRSLDSFLGAIDCVWSKVICKLKHGVQTVETGDHDELYRSVHLATSKSAKNAQHDILTVYTAPPLPRGPG